MLAAAQGTVGGVDPLAAYDYHLPPERIAQRPAPRRDQSRLLVLPRRGGPISHQGMADCADRLRPGDLLVLNDTKVVPARLTAAKPPGGRVEILLLSPANPRETSAEGEVQEVLLRSHRPLKAGARLSLAGDPPADVLVLKKGARGKALVSFPSPALALAEARGDVPLPPYIKRPQGTSPEDRERYQTVYARRPGAAAAPTAGLHLTNRLLAVLRRRGVETATLTLRVGYGTFADPAPEGLAAGGGRAGGGGGRAVPGARRPGDACVHLMPAGLGVGRRAGGNPQAPTGMVRPAHRRGLFISGGGRPFDQLSSAPDHPADAHVRPGRAGPGAGGLCRSRETGLPLL